MSKPRQIIPGSTYLITRRTAGRKYLLKPTPLVRQVFCYCLAHAAQTYNMQIHGYCVMSNHYHIVATDPDGKLPAFMSWLNEFIAKALNCVWGRWEYFWAPNTYSAVRLETADDIVDKLIYTLANPVKAGLVSDSSKWPGVTSRTIPFGAKQSFQMPKAFFRKNGPLPETTSLILEVPDAFGQSPSGFKALINQHLNETETDLRINTKSQKKTFLGIAAIRALRHTDCPTSFEIKRNLNPHVASKDGDALRNALYRLKWFRSEYAAARERLDKGDATATFPFGTYGLKKLVLIQSIPPPDCLWI